MSATAARFNKNGSLNMWDVKKQQWVLKKAKKVRKNIYKQDPDVILCNDKR